MGKFLGDLQEAQVAEKEVKQLLTFCHSHLWKFAIVPDGNYKYADLILNLGVEIKYDKRARDTGNVAIEVGFRGRPSGLTSTTATFWAFHLGEEVYLTETEQLRYRIHGRPIIPGGDNLMAELVLLPVSELVQISIPLGEE